MYYNFYLLCIQVVSYSTCHLGGPAVVFNNYFKIRHNDIPSKIIKFYWHVLLCFTQMKTGGGGVYDKPSQNSNYVTGVVYIYIHTWFSWGGGLSILS